MSNRGESGRLMAEILAVLAIVSLLSIGSFWGIRRLLEKNQANELLNTINMTSIGILSALEKENFATLDDWDRFLSHFTQYSGDYKISFFVPENNLSGKDFTLKVERTDGAPLNPNICKDLIMSMRSQYSLSGIDFQKNGMDAHLAMEAVDLNAICGR